jgi:sugar lactone lactonase YvrE
MFGGEELQTLYITSAWEGLSDAARAKQPQAGSLFAADVGVKGLVLPLFDA